VVVPLERTVEAVEVTIDHLAEMHALGYHHGSPVGIRFGAASRHLLAMHYGRRTCTIEAPVLLGMRRDSHDATHSEADISYMLGEFTNRFLRDPRLNARVHWGQRHTLTREHITSAYSGYTTWENQMRTFNPYGIFDNRLITDLAPIRVVTVTRGKAWVWANQPTATHYIPHTGYQYNSAGGSNQISRLATGQYQVDLPWLATSGGMVHAVAYGGNHYCKVVKWSPFESKQRIRVNCFSPDGRPIDGQFILLFYKESRGATWANAYLWANQASAESYTPDTAYQWNSKGGLNTVRRLNVGHYQVTLPGINVLGGTVLATAYGPGTERCKVGGWGLSGNDTVVTVYCFDPSGNPVDTRFTLSFMTDVGLGIRVSEDQHYGAYIWADQPIAASYIPNRTYQLNTTGNSINQITRSSTGLYTVNFPRLKSFKSTAALSVAYGSGSEYCAVQSWVDDGRGGTNVVIRCFNRSGNPTDTRFTVIYLTNENILL
jgi:D-arabinono-1,4-lactone oxidase